MTRVMMAGVRMMAHSSIDLQLSKRFSRTASDQMIFERERTEDSKSYVGDCGFPRIYHSADQVLQTIRIQGIDLNSNARPCEGTSSSFGLRVIETMPTESHFTAKEVKAVA